MAAGASQDSAERYVIVRRRNDEADGVISLDLVDPGEAPLPMWEPGAHIDVCVPDGTRQYSLAGDPADRHVYRVGVLLQADGRGGSKFVHENLRVGSRLKIRTPRNNFRFESAGRYLFVAGGIGITPLLPMIASAHAQGLPWTLIYGGRTRRSMAFLDELAVYGNRVRVVPQDECGLLDLDEIAQVRSDTHVYCCGPEPLLAAVERVCEGWESKRLHLERFAAKDMETPQACVAFEVECVDSGVTVTVPPEQSMLDALLARGIDLNFDCREGTCGSCELEVLDGVADHRDSILTAAERQEGKIIFPCVSRADGGRLVVDA